MSRSTTFFRWVWRVDAIVILVAAGAIAFGAGAMRLHVGSFLLTF